MPVDLGEDADLLSRLRKRSQFVFGAFLVFVTIIIGRLWFLQVLRADYYTELCEQNRIRIVTDEAPRGAVFDRESRKLVWNQPSYEVLVNRDNRLASESLFRFSRLAGIPEERITDVLKTKNNGRTATVVRDISRKVLSILEEHRVELPGLEVAIRPKRRFLRPTFACHVIGYLAEAQRGEIERSEGRIRLGDRIGRSGIELLLDEYLRGIDGRRVVEKNAMGRILRTLGRAEKPVPGNNVVLTLDLDLQSAIEESFDVRKGAVVVMDPRSGEILAMVSRPAYDLEAFQGEVSAADWTRLKEDLDTPMNNRCAAGQYPAGSTFKVFVALAALQSGAITTDTRFNCSGTMNLGDAIFHCWKEGGHGDLSVEQGLVHSCNIFFYKTGLACGIGNIARTARQFGLGTPTGFDVTREMSGYIPADGDLTRYRAGDTISASIGQGIILVTPLQMAVAFSALVNGGTVLKPLVVSRVSTPEGTIIKEFHPSAKGHISVDPKHVATVRDALFGVVNREGGTGWRARLASPKVAGKTGTAQVVQRVDNEETALEDIPYGRRPHSWFVGYAPAENPEIVFVVLVEHGGPGGQAAATFAKKIAEAAFADYDLKAEP
ncbi:MAG: penicillin-binding protein 2 [Candidatus Coatesbacteria bacterium]|nr:penicillin-binding protein 2 [Candidatus Coatesbacteria bacterium]